MDKLIRLLMVLLVGGTSLGCTPKVVVRKSNGTHDTGIKYYRPKPYLLITPAGSSVKVQQSSTKSTTTTTQSDQFVSIELQYLPDFTEEYSINVRSGIGTADVSLKLDQGWNLTELNQKIDSQFDENLTAVADLVKAAGTVIPTGDAVTPGEGYRAESFTKKWVVEATNVPLGYYEAVISGDCGKKKMSGWRYVGFAPFNSCPTVFQGEDCADCENDPDGPIYGLVFVKGVMTFRQLNELRSKGETSNEMAEAFVGTTNYQIKSTGEQIMQTIRQELAGQSVRSQEVVVESVEQVEATFPGTLQFKVKTNPPLTQKLKDDVRSAAAKVPGAPPKVQVDFN